MAIFSTEKIRKSILSLLLLFAVSNASKAQIYGASGFDNPTLLEIDITSCADCHVTSVMPLNPAWVPEGGLALCADGTIYSAFHEILYTINPATNEILQIPGMPPLPTDYGLNGLTCSGESGLLYGVLDPSFSYELVEIDVNNLTINIIGALPFPVYHGMFMHKGNVYASASTG
ncbi:MAG TPA: hypothetical protein VGK46_07475, partial [Saprospiraceae bacterium]